MASTLSNSEYRNLLLEIVNLEYDSMVRQANAAAVLAFGQFYRLWAPRVFSQSADFPEDTAAIEFGRDLLEFPDGGRFETDPIACHGAANRRQTNGTT
jgi:hypothetical protein